MIDNMYIAMIVEGVLFLCAVGAILITDVFFHRPAVKALFAAAYVIMTLLFVTAVAYIILT